MLVNFTQKELISALSIVGNYMKIGESILPMIEGTGLNTTVQRIVYMMFVKEVDAYFMKDDSVYDSIQIIKKYTQAIHEEGEVTFA